MERTTHGYGSSPVQQNLNDPNQNNSTTHNSKICMMFTHYSQLVRKITNLFKQINVNIACLSTNTVYDFMKPKTNYAIDEYANSGIHELRCAAYKCCYVGQTSLNLKHRHQEHLRYIKHNHPQLAYTSHILNNVHEYGHVDNILSLLKQANIQRLINELL